MDFHVSPITTMRLVSFFGLLALAIFTGCSPVSGRKVSATAIVRVTQGDSPGTNAVAFMTGIEIFNSVDFADHASKTLELPKLWGVSDIDADEKILKSLKVQSGKDPESIVITIWGIEHSLAVKILNDICTNGVGHPFPDSLTVNGVKPAPVHVSIIQPAR